MTAQTTKPAKKRSIVSALLKLAALCVVVYVAFSVISLQIELSEKKRTLAKLEAQRDALSLANQETSELIEKSDQNEFVERIAREYFGFAYPNEHIYIDISGS